MQKKGNLLPYAIMSLAMGAVLMIMFLRVGIIYGDSDGRIDDYMIKDSALFLTMIYSLPGNIVFNFFYPVHEKIIEIDSSKVSIMYREDNVLKEHFTYRTIGMNDTKKHRIQNQEFYDISKSGNEIKINQPPNLDALPCYVDLGNNIIENVQFRYTNDFGEGQYLRLMYDGIKRIGHLIRFIGYGDVNSPVFSNADQSIILSLNENSNDFVAYVHYKNNQGKNIACRLFNKLAQKNINANSYAVFSIDPLFDKIDNIELTENMVFFKFGNLDSFPNNSPIIENEFVRILEGSR